MKTKRLLCLLLALLMVGSLLTGCGGKTEQKKEFETFEDFENARLGVLTGSEFDRQTQVLFPNCERYQQSNLVDLLLSLDADKIDGLLLDSVFYSAIGWEKQGYKIIKSDKTTPVEYAFMLSDSAMADQIQAEFDEFITEEKENGNIEELAKKWFSGVRPTEFEDYSSLSGENGTISVAIADSDMPVSYVSEGLARGFDVELVIRFAKEYGYGIEFHAVDFDTKLAGITSNKYDVAIGGITVTEERREEMDFTATYYVSPVYMVTKGEASSAISDLSDKRIGLVTGSIFAVTLPPILPDANFMEFNTYADVISALENGKIDTFPTDESIYKAMLWEGSAVDRIDESIAVSDYGMIFQKGGNRTLQAQINEYLAQTKEDGTHEALEAKWFGNSEPTEFASYDDLKGASGTLRIGVASDSKPFVYQKNGKLTGFDIEFITAFAKEYGYKLQFEDTAFAGIMAGVSTGKYDIGMSGVTITDERKENVDFSDIYHTEDLVFVIKSEVDENSLSQFNNATLGVVTGSLYGGYSRELLFRQDLLTGLGFFIKFCDQSGDLLGGDTEILGHFTDTIFQQTTHISHLRR